MDKKLLLNVPPMRSHSTKKLIDLPSEVISQILSHAQTASVLRNLSLTCRYLHQLIEAEGWRAFVQTRFPSIPVPPFWKDAAHALTTLSRNLDRRAFLAQHLEPPDSLLARQVGTRRRWQKRQTMGYQPVLDSYDVITGNTWDSRKEIVAWGAGVELIIKTVTHGKGVQKDYERAPKAQCSSQDTHGIGPEWHIYRDAKHADGRDDITTVNILRSSQKLQYGNNNTAEHVIVGRAGGELAMLRLSNRSSYHVIREYETKNSPIRSSDITSGPSPLLAVSFLDSRIALYAVHGESHQALPLSEVRSVSDVEKGCRAWSTRFLSRDKLAIGRGPSRKLICVYNVGTDGLSREPLRVFNGTSAKTSVYPIVGIPELSVPDHVVGNAFLSGGYDGIIRLHDMRSPADCEAVISDPTDDPAIFSLLMIGRERVIAGTAHHSLLKIFDLRMCSGGRTYSYLNVPSETGHPVSASTTRGIVRRPNDSHPRIINQSGCNIFAAPPIQQHSTYWYENNSPVYSLSSPSPSSNSLFLGMEGRVLHINFTSMLDDYPDPVFRHKIQRKETGIIDIEKTWNPFGQVLQLSMYNHTARSALMSQTPVGPLTGRQNVISGLDDRWYDMGAAFRTHS